MANLHVACASQIYLCILLIYRKFTGCMAVRITDAQKFTGCMAVRVQALYAYIPCTAQTVGQ